MRKLTASIVFVLMISGLIWAQTPPGGRTPTAASDALIDVGGRRLHLSCSGAGSPTVILEAGLGQASLSEVWGSVPSAIAMFTRVCAYDRAGRGTSDPDPRTATEFRTGWTAVDDLRELLRVAAIAKPYVLVGHSLGGAYARLYASRFPDEVAGLVLVDASHEDQRIVFKAAGYAEPDPPTGQNAERTDLSAVLEELRQSRLRADMPLVVLSHGRKLPLRNASVDVVDRVEAAWLGLQRQLASRSSNGRLVVAERSGHNIQRDEPQVVVEAVGQVLSQVKPGR
jgi:pimeloyl-ACP methyl ester carboxylesterase